jgi:hypothetical protein
MKTYTNYKEAKKEADKTGAPLWDTHTSPDRYVVGELTAEIEEDPDNDWTQLQ